nr:arginine decarboxylase [Thalassobacillus sp. C254]
MRKLLVINPTYFGVAADLASIVEIAHSYDVPVLVDEAHGVHIHFHESLPLSAMQAGADMAATSVHKLGGSMTQSSVLNVRKGLVSPQRVQSIMSMLTTTSTSYLLLASLDAARKHLATQGRDLLEKTMRLANQTRSSLNEIKGISCTDFSNNNSKAVHSFDPTKLLISVYDLGITGYEAELWLRTHYNIEVELSDLYNILCIVSFGDSEKETSLLVKAIQRMSLEKEAVHKETEVTSLSLPDIPTLSMLPRDAFYTDTELIPFYETAGRIIAEFIMVYPPGIPILLPGEIITEENLIYIEKNMKAGLPVQGPEDPSLQKIKVIKEHKPII